MTEEFYKQCGQIAIDQNDQEFSQNDQFVDQAENWSKWPVVRPVFTKFFQTTSIFDQTTRNFLSQIFFWKKIQIFFATFW